MKVIIGSWQIPHQILTRGKNYLVCLSKFIKILKIGLVPNWIVAYIENNYIKIIKMNIQ